tara:strand:- start:1263 stop:1478 length:216 start_codon:yes stop_codon:yes gene_type:complete
MIFGMLSDAAKAYNDISWPDAIPFLALIIGLYWVKVKIDSRIGLGKKKKRELKATILEALNEWDRTNDNQY